MITRLKYIRHLDILDREKQMDFPRKAKGIFEKAVSKAKTTALDSTSKVINVAKDKAEEKFHEDKGNDELPFKLILRQRPFTCRDQFKIYDESGEVIYRAQGNFFLPAWTLTIYDSNGFLIGKLHKKMLAFRSPLDRHEGSNVEFEVEINGAKVGSLRNKRLGRRFDRPSKQFNDFKQSFLGSHYEYDFVDMEIVNKNFSFRYEIYTKSGEILSKSMQKIFSRGDCYTIYYSKKEDELLCLLMILAMDFLQDGRSMKERYDQQRYFYSSEDSY